MNSSQLKKDDIPVQIVEYKFLTKQCFKNFLTDTEIFDLKVISISKKISL